VTPAEMRARAIEHAPIEMSEAIRTLANQGFGDASIAEITGLDVAAVRRLLGPRCEGCGE
jgi:DNA-directed RNA polymerase specialized sigma24 family protein